MTLETATTGSTQKVVKTTSDDSTSHPSKQVPKNQKKTSSSLFLTRKLQAFQDHKISIIEISVMTLNSNGKIWGPVSRIHKTSQANSTNH